MTTQSFPVGDAPRVVVSECRRDLEIEVWDERAIQVECDGRIDRINPSDEAFTIENAHEDLRLRVPADTEIVVERAHADVVVRGVRTLTLNDARGDVLIEDIENGVRIDTVVLGYAYSMGAIVLQAGDTRTIGRFGTLMLHSSQWMISGEDERVFKDYQRLSAHYQEVVAQLFAARTGQRDSAWWRRYIWSGRDRFLGPDECLQLGLVDRVEEPILVDRPGFRIGPPPEAPSAAAEPPPIAHG